MKNSPNSSIRWIAGIGGAWIWLVHLLIPTAGFSESPEVGGLPESFYQSEVWLKAQSEPEEVLQTFGSGEEGALAALPQLMVRCKAHFHQGDFQRADSLLPVVWEKALVKGDSAEWLPLVRLTARIQKVRLNFDAALESYRFLLNAYQNNGDKVREAETFIDLGEFSRSVFQHQQGFEYLEKAKAINSQHPLPKRMMARLFGREAALYCEGSKDYRSAEKSSLQALEMAEQLADADLIATCCNELGYIYSELGESTALDFFLRAEDIWEEMGNYRYLAHVRMNIARHYLYIGNDAGAIEKAMEVVAESKRYGWQSLEWTAYEILAQAYAESGDLPNLANSVENALALATALHEERHSKELTEALARHQADIALKDLELSRAENERIKAQSRQRTILLWATAGGLVLLLLVAMATFRAYRLKRRANDLLEQKNSEKEALLKEIHHRVKNNLQVISSLLNLQSGATTDPSAHDAIKQGQNRVKSIALIHQKLYQTEDLAHVDFQEYSEQLVAFLSTAFARKGKKVTTHIQANGLQLDIDTAVPLGLIINELVSNSWKYAFCDQDLGEIHLEVVRGAGEGEIQLHYYDNGPGLPEGLDLAKSSSLGLKLVNILSRQLKGKVESFNKDGAHFRLSIRETGLSRQSA